MMTEQEKLGKYLSESLSRYISFMFDEASESAQDHIFALLKDDVGAERCEELWGQACHIAKMMQDMDNRMESLWDSENNNKNKE